METVNPKLTAFHSKKEKMNENIYICFCSFNNKLFVWKKIPFHTT